MTRMAGARRLFLQLLLAGAALDQRYGDSLTRDFERFHKLFRPNLFD